MAASARTSTWAGQRHWALHAFFWAMIGAIVVLPAWIMFGRTLAGAPLGDWLLLQALLGPTVRLQTTKLNTKAPGGGAAVEWHQDWAFYPHTMTISWRSG